MQERYFDHAATTPVDPRVLREAEPFFSLDFGNAHSLHAAGRKAEAAVEQARERIARLIGAEDPSQIVFTSGATEANNWVLKAFPNARISPFEHSSLFEPARRRGLRPLANAGLSLIAPDEEIDLESVMAVNNEIGARWDAASLKGAAKFVHSDLTQLAGKLPCSVEGIDFASPIPFIP